MGDFTKRVKIRVGGEEEIRGLGRAMGGTAGHAVTMLGRIKDLGERLGGFKIALMGIGAAVVFAGKQLYDLANGPMNRLITQTQESIKAAKELADQFRKTLDSAALEAAGMGKMGEIWLAMRRQWYDLDLKRADLEGKIAELKQQELAAEGTIATVGFKGAREKLEALLAQVRAQQGGMGALIPEAKAGGEKEVASEMKERAEKATAEAKRQAEEWNRQQKAGHGWDWLGLNDLEHYSIPRLKTLLLNAGKEFNEKKDVQDRYWIGVNRQLGNDLAEQQMTWQEELDDRRLEAAERSARNRKELEQQHIEQIRDYAELGADILVNAATVGIESGGKAMAKVLAKELKALAISYAVKAVASLAEAAFAAMQYRYGDVPKALQSAAQCAAAAAACGVGAAALGAMGGGGGSTSASSSSDRYSSQGRSGDEGKRESGSVTIIVNGNMLGGRDSGKQLAKYLDEYYDSKNPGRAHDRVTG